MSNYIPRITRKTAEDSKQKAKTPQATFLKMKVIYFSDTQTLECTPQKRNYCK